MKPVDVKSNTHIDSNKEINNKDPEFKIGDIVNKSFLWLKKLKTLCHGHVINDLNA